MRDRQQSDAGNACPSFRFVWTVDNTKQVIDTRHRPEKCRNPRGIPVSRLSAIPREQLPEQQRRFYDAVQAIRRRPISGPFIVLMNSSPDLAARFAHLGHYFHSRGQADESVLPLRTRAFVSLVGSRALDAPYEWAAWVNWALEAGIVQETVDAIREGRVPPQLTAEEVLLTGFCTQLVSGDHRLSPATFDAALERFGSRGLVELVVTLGYFAMIALPLNAFEMTMTDAQKKLRKPFAPLRVGGQPSAAAADPRRKLPPLSAGSGTPRLPLLSRHDDLAPADQHFLDRIVLGRGRIPAPFQLLLHTPDVAERVASIGGFFLYETQLPPAVSALTWLLGARELDCAYTWHAAVAVARVAGAEAAQLERIEQGRLPEGEEAGQVTAFCLQLLRGNHHVDEKTYGAVIARHGIPGAVQIAATLGYIVMMSLLANAFELAAAESDDGPAL